MWLRKGDYEVIDDRLIRVNWTSRRNNWDFVRYLTFWERIAARFGVFPRIDE